MRRETFYKNHRVRRKRHGVHTQVEKREKRKKENDMAEKQKDEARTSDVALRATVWAWIVGFVSTILMMAFLSYTGSPWAGICALAIVAEVIGGLVFMFSGKNAEGVKAKLAVCFWVMAAVAGMNAVGTFCNGIYQAGTMAKDWLDFSMSVQPDMQEKVVAGSLVLEVGLAFLIGVAGYLILHSWLRLVDEKLGVAIAFTLGALLRGQLEVYLLALCMGLVGVALLKTLLTQGSNEAIDAAQKRGYQKLAIGIGASSLVCIGLFVSQGMTWMTGLIVVFSDYPFTALSFVAQGALVGGWYAIKFD